MSEQLQALLQLGVKTPIFPPNSRYHRIDTASIKTQEGKTITHIRRRFVPPAENFATIQEHMVKESDRLDLLAAHYLGDPEIFWRLCDANNAIRPNDLVRTPGRIIHITLPEAIPQAISGV